MPTGGVSALPAILRRAGPLPSVPARHGAPLQHGRIFVAVPNHHLIVSDGRMGLSHGPTESGYRPAIDVLFRSAARAAGPRVIGVVLSGVLDDGTAGLASIVRRGGVALVQRPEDALFAGMPRNALRHIPIATALPAGEMGPLLEQLVTEQVDVDAAPAPTALDILESDIAALANEDVEREVNDVFGYSGFSCPDCHGNLVELDDDTTRYRCRVGHAWTAGALLDKQSSDLERALWMALRTLDEKVALAKRLADDAQQRGSDTLSERYLNSAEESEAASAVLRDFLLSGRLTQATESSNA